MTARVMTNRPPSVNAGQQMASGGHVQPTMYQICIRGRVTERLGSALEGMRILSRSSDTVFAGEIRDQSQLYGLLDRVRDMGLELISVAPLTVIELATDESAD
jgi:hypothetical protein